MTVKVVHDDRYGAKRDCEMIVKAEASADGKGAAITPIQQNCDSRSHEGKRNMYSISNDAYRLRLMFRALDRTDAELHGHRQMYLDCAWRLAARLIAGQGL